jgi:hypothetical protein
MKNRRQSNEYRSTEKFNSDFKKTSVSIGRKLRKIDQRIRCPQNCNRVTFGEAFQVIKVGQLIVLRSDLIRQRKNFVE